MVEFNRLFDALYYQYEFTPKATDPCGKENGHYVKYSTQEVINIVKSTQLCSPRLRHPAR